jgi:hypothetical protein
MKTENPKIVPNSTARLAVGRELCSWRLSFSKKRTLSCAVKINPLTQNLTTCTTSM